MVNEMLTETNMYLNEEDLFGIVRRGVADTYLIVYSKVGADVLSLTPDKMRQLKKIWKQYKKAMKNANRVAPESDNPFWETIR